jgi:hypothetical protein
MYRGEEIVVSAMRRFIGSQCAEAAKLSVGPMMLAFERGKSTMMKHALSVTRISAISERPSRQVAALLEATLSARNII